MLEDPAVCVGCDSSWQHNHDCKQKHESLVSWRANYKLTDVLTHTWSHMRKWRKEHRKCPTGSITELYNNNEKDVIHFVCVKTIHYASKVPHTLKSVFQSDLMWLFYRADYSHHAALQWLCRYENRNPINVSARKWIRVPPKTIPQPDDDATTVSIHQWAPTRLDIQRVLINGQVHGLVGCVTEIFQDQIDGGGDATRHRFPKFHPAVDHDAPIPEVQDLQVLKVTQVGLQVGHKLGKDFFFKDFFFLNVFWF